MKQDDELWMKQMKQMLQEYTEPAPPEAWDRISKDLLATPVKPKVIYRKWWAAAAAILVLAVSGGSFYFLHTPMAEDIRFTEVPGIEAIPDIVPVKPLPESIAAQIKPDEPTKVKTYVAQAKILTAVVEDATEPEVADNMSEKETIVTDEPTDTRIPEDKQSGSKNKEPDNYQKRNTETRKYVPPTRKSAKKNDWAMGVSVNSGTASLLNNDQNAPLQINRTSSLSTEDLSSVATNSTGFIDLTDKNLIFKEGTFQVAEYEKVDHQLPITVGLSVRKQLMNGFSVETGLSYTFLKSDITQSTVDGERKGEQKLHYIGIPVRANWDFVNTRNFTVYLSAGGMVEKRVYGKTIDGNTTDNPFQFSLNGGVGAQYNINNKIGLYVEPGVSYFFDDDSKIETIRKETPLNFNLQAGVRFTY